MNPKSDRVKLDYSHYVCLPDDGKRHEIIEGDHYVNPAPSTYHQTVSRRIQFELYAKIELTGLGEVYDAPVDLQVGDHNIIQPDIVVVLNERKTIITPTKIKGIPHLVIEILSPSSIENDRNLKRDVYERTGIGEYWIVDPFEHKLEQLVLMDGKYQTTDCANLVTPTFIDDVSVDLQKVW